MKQKKSIIIYESYHHFNTEQIARVIAQRLKGELYKPEEIDYRILGDYDLIGIGSGIYFGKPHIKIQQFLSRIPKIHDVKAFFFMTSGIYREKYIRNVHDQMEEKGLVVLNHFWCKGWDTFGPLKMIGGMNKGHPNINDLYHAELFANTL